MLKNFHVFFLSLILILVAVLLIGYKVLKLHVPLQEDENTPIWTVQARVTYQPKNGPVIVNLQLPNKPRGFVQLDEDFVSGNYGLSVENDTEHRYAQWTARRPKGSQVLYYRTQLMAVEQEDDTQQTVVYPQKKQFDEILQTIVDALLAEVRSKSADTKSFTHELLIRLNADAQSDNIQLIKEGFTKPDAWVQRIIEILQAARIPARQVNTLQLKDGLIHGQLTPWLEVFNGERWLPFNPNTGKFGFPESVLIWNYGKTPLLQVEGGKKAKIEFSIFRQFADKTTVALQRANLQNSWAMTFSLFNLPVQTQNIYRIILMVPIGALLVVIFRNIIGIRSFGTFMPILIAMAFRETELLWGIVLFTSLVALGLLLRFYLEYLQLLLVPRLAAVLVIVIVLMLLISLLTHKLGIDRGLSIALFPMVIMAMTIERMSLVWEEQGADEALRQGFGTLFIATCSYLLMTESHIQHLIFVFPELLLIMLAFTLLLGRYTGYRLTELWRFKSFIKSTTEQ